MRAVNNYMDNKNEFYGKFNFISKFLLEEHYFLLRAHYQTFCRTRSNNNVVILSKSHMRLCCAHKSFT